ncbi:MAG TPA: nicotinamide-nucleotide amidohydrolase family protein [Dongiaceae bacterium]|jgi:nicotinamide-nucleotide amidase|nr:nicotinamide-nucleotide amidohydrolase family protein [Dongiaceae bacterium]
MDDLAAILALYRTRGWRIATAESCTGGLLAAALTEISGASDVFDRGFITYSNQAKQEMLGIDPARLARHGAVSAEVAADMAAGALLRSAADIALAITGIAGPGGATPDKPVGLVYFGLAGQTILPRTEYRIFEGDRGDIRTRAVGHALDLLFREAAL